MKSSTWKRFAVGMAAVWLIVFVATIGASIYREIDGPTVRSVQAENRALRIENKRLTETLQLVSHEFDDTMANLTSMQTDRDFISVKLADAEVRGNGFAEELEQFKTWWPGGLAIGKHPVAYLGLANSSVNRKQAPIFRHD